MAVDFDRLMAMFQEALEEHSPEEWDDFVQRSAGDDAELQRQARQLLHAHAHGHSLLDKPVVTCPTFERPITEQPGDTIGPYTLLQQIGEGGMGVVYMAEQTEPVERRVALKIIKPGMDTRQVIARFEAERQALAMMDHPNIAKVLDAGTTDTGRPYFVMELVHGVPITQYCDEHQLTPRERLELFVPICQAVQHAHQKGIIHRDIKASNVLVALYDDRPVPKIIDFGLAKAISQRLTERTLFTEYGQVVGTPEYMSPEQAQLNHLDIDTRTDVYSLGVLLYELLAGETPFDRQRLRNAAFDELLRIIREEEPPRPSLKLSTSDSLPTIAANRHVEPKKLSTLVHGELDWIVMKALEKDRTRRYDTASKFAEDVQHYLNDEAVAACPPSAAYKFRKFARRNKPVIGTTAAIAAALLAGIFGTAWQAIRATQERNLAANERDRAVAAEAKAVEEAERADTQAAIAKAVNEFLQIDLLGMADAASQAEARLSPDPNIKLGTLLDRAAEKVDERFSDQPLTEASVRVVLGNAYRGIGKFEEAEKHFRRALQLRVDTLGPEHPETLLVLHNVALAVEDQGRYDDAEEIFRRAADSLTQVLGPDHFLTLKANTCLAMTLLEQGRLTEPARLLHETLDRATRVLGENHGLTLMAATVSANCFAKQGDYVKAGKLHQQVYEIRKTALGELHPYTLSSLMGWANCLGAQGDSETALLLHRQVYESSRRTRGDEHPETLGAAFNLAESLARSEKLSQAQQLQVKVLQIRRKLLGEDHPDTLASMVSLANIYIRTGRFEEAKNLHERALDVRRRQLGEEHPDTLSSMMNLAMVQADLRRYREAELLHTKALEIRSRTLGKEHANTLNSMNNLACVYYYQGRYDEAETLYQKVLEIELRTLGAEHPNTLSSADNLTAAYLSHSWAAATSPAISERDPSLSLDIARKAVDLSPEKPDCWENLGVALCRNERWQEAIEAFEKARTLRGEDYSRGCQFFLAMAHWQVGQKDEALANYKEAVTWMQESDRGDEPRRFQAEAEDVMGMNPHVSAEHEPSTNEQAADSTDLPLEAPDQETEELEKK